MSRYHIITLLFATFGITSVLLFDTIGRNPLTFSQLQTNKAETMKKYEKDWSDTTVKVAKQSPYTYAIGDTIATITIPRMNIYELPVLYGSNPVNNNWHITSPGHAGNWSLFGEPGVSCVGAHNYQLFKDLTKLRKGDKVLIETSLDRYVYEVYDTAVYHHEKDNWESVAAYHKNDHALNLMTCYPLDAVKTDDMYIVYTSLQKGTLFKNLT